MTRERDAEHFVEDRNSRAQLELTCRLGGTMSRRDLVTDTDVVRWILYDVDATRGRVRWQRVIHEPVPARPVHMKNSYASETPATEGQRAYAYLGYVGLFAYEMRG